MDNGRRRTHGPAIVYAMSRLPGNLGDRFSVADARAAGASDERMRRADLTAPFHGVRRRRDADDHPLEHADPYARQRSEHLEHVLDLVPRLNPGQFISQFSAAAVWNGPMPLIRDPETDVVLHGATLPVHVTVFGHEPLPRLKGVIGHRARAQTTSIRHVRGVPVTDPASTWASNGHLGLHDLVALGDCFCRVWRTGVGRPDAERASLSSIRELQDVIASGRRVGIRRLREAVELIREDSWSPRESKLRCALVDARLPEPELNIDVFDGRGAFLACVDLAYPEAKVAIEYQSMLHSSRYSQDVERLAALRAAGWTVIEVTSDLLRHPEVLVSRVRAALRAAHRCPFPSQKSSDRTSESDGKCDGSALVLGLGGGGRRGTGTAPDPGGAGAVRAGAQTRSKRSSSMTFVHAATKSATKRSPESSAA